MPSLQGLSKSVQDRVLMVRSNYGSAENFLIKYHPSCASEMVSTIGKAEMMKADTPTLTIIKHAFGYKTATTFLSNFVRMVAKWNNLLDRTDPETIFDIADSIMQEYYYLKASELVVFFQNLRNAGFRDRHDDDRGKMYGGLSGEVIMDCLYKFKEERNRYIEEQKGEEQRKKHDEMIANAASPDEAKKHLAKILGSGNNTLLESVAVGNGWMTKQEAEDARREHIKSINKDTITKFKPMSTEEIRQRNERMEAFNELLRQQQLKEQAKDINNN